MCTRRGGPRLRARGVADGGLLRARGGPSCALLAVSRMASRVARLDGAPFAGFPRESGVESRAAAQQEASLGLEPPLVSRAAPSRTSAEQGPTESDIPAGPDPLDGVRNRTNANFRPASCPRTRAESDSVAACFADVRFEGVLLGGVGPSRPEQPRRPSRPS